MPLVRIAPKRMEPEVPALDLAKIPIGLYPAVIKTAEDMTGVYKSGRDAGKPYTARELYLNVTVANQVVELRARVFESSSAEKTLQKTFENDPLVHKTEDLAGKKVQIQLTRNRSGFLTVTEFYPA